MKKTLLLLSLILRLGSSNANNIQLANVLLNGQNTTSQFSLVNFDVSWDNSWRTITNEANYDGAWIFVKFRKKTSSLWQHATLSSTGFTTPANSILQVAADGKGIWMYHTLPGADFTGNVNYTGAKVQWNYGVDGVLNTDSVEIKVFALEMVNVPQGKFNLGSGGTETFAFIEGSKTTPYSVTTEGAINVANTATNLFYAGGGGDQTGPIPANYPKGFNAYWLMKYESSQQQYVDFLNTLDITPASNRNPVTFVTGTYPNFTTLTPERAAFSLSINDGLAFSDWAALRPFTELEYEKACRGFNQAAIPNEYAWGNTTIAATTAVTGAGTASETANNGNANYQGSYALPTRCGIYANATSNRQQSGGTYYGIMDMSGNVDEITINVGSVGGRAFTNTNGDGSLTPAGDANVAVWPGNGSYSLRGGYFSDVPARLSVSDRTFGIYGGNNLTRTVLAGIRLARTAE